MADQIHRVVTIQAAQTRAAIPAITTRYKGRLYRSRLEARWAAFFDLLFWKHEYEPLDLRGWFPDFRLTGQRIDGSDRPVLAEVKPITEYDPAVGAKMTNALFDMEHPPALDLLLLGCAPFTTSRGEFVVGWHVNSDYDSDTRTSGSLAAFKCFAGPKGLVIDIADDCPADGLLTAWSSYYPWNGQTDCYRPDLLDGGQQAAEIGRLLMAKWAEAANRVQWRGREAQP